MFPVPSRCSPWLFHSGLKPCLCVIKILSSWINLGGDCRSPPEAIKPDYDNADGTNFDKLADQVKTKVCPAVPVPAVMMLPADVQVQVEPAAEITVNEHSPLAVALQPTGTVNPLMAPEPLITKTGPVGRTAPVAAATVVV